MFTLILGVYMGEKGLFSSWAWTSEDWASNSPACLTMGENNGEEEDEGPALWGVSTDSLAILLFFRGVTKSKINKSQ